MERTILSNKPLVEAIFELRWALEESGPGPKSDPHYTLLIGRLYEQLGEKYPFHQQLPSAVIPGDIAAYLVQHQFRKGEDQWPVVQIGPGIITVNDTDTYVWEDFRNRIVETVKALFKVYPTSDHGLVPEALVLRYIDGVPFDFQEGDVLAFLGQMLKTHVDLSQALFEDARVNPIAKALDLRLAFESTEPKGTIRLRFVRGHLQDSDALLWETVVESRSAELPALPDGIRSWAEAAHGVTHDWFFKLIEGELLERFK
jgi:uncharacterized protein (TIGR04255 family)